VIHINDQKALRINNQLSILNVLKDYGPLSRKQLQDKTGLSWGTITYLTGELIDLDIIRETGMVATNIGRPPTNLDLNTENNYIVALWLGDVQIGAIMLDIKGQRVLERSFPLDPSARSDEIVGRLFSAVDVLIEETGVPITRIAGIGCAVPGSYNPRTGMCVYAPNHPDWRNVPLLNLLSDRYGRPAFVDHDMNCCVLGEHLFGSARDLSDFVCVNIEGGIGAGIMISGRIYRGVDNSAGELGHIRVKPDGPRCNCGGVGCLESVASVAALLARAREIPGLADLDSRNGATGHGGLAGDLDILIRFAEDGNAAVLSLFEEVGRYLGVGVGILVMLFNPETVILSGTLCGAKDFLRTSMDESLNKTAWPYSRSDVRFSTLDNGIVMGAGGMVLQEVFTSALLLRGQAGGPGAALGYK
jgi:predicted NBD/HSP70 family sugar kinase